MWRIIIGTPVIFRVNSALIIMRRKQWNVWSSRAIKSLKSLNEGPMLCPRNHQFHRSLRSWKGLTLIPHHLFLIKRKVRFISSDLHLDKFIVSVKGESLANSQENLIRRTLNCHSRFVSNYSFTCHTFSSPNSACYSHRQAKRGISQCGSSIDNNGTRKCFMDRGAHKASAGHNETNWKVRKSRHKEYILHLRCRFN